MKKKFFNYTKKDNDGNTNLNVLKVIIHIALAIFVVIPILFGSWGIVNAGERGVKVRFGAVIGTVDEGLYFKLPYIEGVQIMDVKVQKDEVEANAASKDLQTVSSKLAINFNLSPDYAAVIYRSVGMNYKSRIIDPAVQESVKAVTAKYTAEELVTKREDVRDEIKTTLSDKMLLYGIIIDQVNITDFDFSESFNSAIEAKVTAEQSALAAKNKLEQIKFEAEQTVTTAKAQAEAIQIQAEAITQQGGDAYVSLQWVNAWQSGGAQVPNVVSGTGSNFLLNIPDIGGAK